MDRLEDFFDVEEVSLHQAEDEIEEGRRRNPKEDAQRTTVVHLE